MDRFTVRVELFDTDDGTSEEYDILHEQMETKGFTRTIISGDDGTEYQLPPAEYNLIGNYAAEDVRDMASLAAAATGKKYSVLVTPSTGRYWVGLKKVKNKVKA